eukprot:TRINITY_DN23150_c0_g1_i1.p1 TRINITY_DN23150_c0_g1~~TRINITY_DN23150_c0_g1_i1.p1  ORF type:complete len:547 (+),score=150.35 TRINITY_DN23150_c0_g1_i1:47-1687(+)
MLAKAMFAVLVGTCAGQLPGPEVMTKQGAVKGRISVEEGTEYFYGIPFAEPPLGKLRFSPPVKKGPWNETIVTGLEQTPFCPQMHATKNIFTGKEDCLTLEVYRPSLRTEKLPVMVWIYGGAFVLGGDDQGGDYNGKELARKHNVIVVSMNYRLGNLGFLALQSLMNEHNTTGNYGLLDQQLALKWVQENIEAFGGNKDKVTIFGESAGGCSIVAQISMPGSRGLFHGAIAESSLPVSDIMWYSYKNATTFGEFYSQHVNCSAGPSQLDCLRSLSLDDVLSPLLAWRKAYPKAEAGIMPRVAPIMNWWPVVDGRALPESPIDMALNGQTADVPLIIGTNKDEGTIFVPGVVLVVNDPIPVVYPLTPEGFQKSLRHFLNESTAKTVTDFYQTNSMSLTQVMDRILRDFIFTCPTRHLLRAIVKHPGRKSPAFQYQFTQVLNSPAYNKTGDYHSSEIPYVFALASKGTNWTTSDYVLSDKMSGFWTSLPKDGYPNCPSCVSWEPYTYNEDTKTGTDNHMDLTTPISMKTNLYTDACDMWDKLGYNNNP